MKYLSFLALLILISCGTGETRQNIDDNAYRTSGVEQFFLPELPNWANSSVSGKCFKTSSLHYLDFSKLAGSYKLEYVQMLELQAQFNQKLEDYFRSTAQRFLKPVEEASFFSNTLEQVRGGIRNFKIPQVNDVEIIWLEGYLQKHTAADLRKLAAQGRFDTKLPVLFSSCQTKQSLTQWNSENDLDQVGFYLLTSEYLSPYSSESKLEAGLKIEIAKLFNSGVRLTYFLEQQPNEFVLP
jgi:hypothetical protein